MTDRIALRVLNTGGKVFFEVSLLGIDWVWFSDLKRCTTIKQEFKLRAPTIREKLC